MSRSGAVRGLVRACHPVPALAVTVVVSAFAWSMGWRGWPLALLLVTILIGQLSIGWSNDAFDARIDAAAGRVGKPTVTGLVTPRRLWIGATLALVAACVLSLVVAGVVGGLFHVFALVMAWVYNVALSRTPWSWVPYALAFGALPAFLSYGLDGSAPPAWTVAVFAIVSVAGHLANSVPDLESDSSAGVDGLALRLGSRRSLALCWILLASGTAILAVVIAGDRPIVAVVAVCAFLLALTASVANSALTFRALLVVVLVDVLTLVAAGTVGG